MYVVSKYILQEAAECLSKTTPTSELTTPTNTLPPPRLISKTNTSMTFEPVPFSDKSLCSCVCYYRVFGRTAAGSNVIVRLSDHALTGTGVEASPPHSYHRTHSPSLVQVCAGERVIVRGLKTGVEYVFAVAGYSVDGQLVGAGIGATGRAHLASFSYPALFAWGELCKVSVSVYTYIRMCMCLHVCILMVYVYVCACVYTEVMVCVHVCILDGMYTGWYVCMCVGWVCVWC